MSNNEIEPKEESKVVAEEGLNEKELENVSGGFNPQPDPPKVGNS
jgi:bacteriocin-like protein